MAVAFLAFMCGIVWTSSLVIGSLTVSIGLGLRFLRFRRGRPQPRGGRILAFAGILFGILGLFFVHSLIGARRDDAYRADLLKRRRAAQLRGDEREAQDLLVELELPLIESDLRSLKGTLQRHRTREGTYPPALIPYLIPPHIGTHLGLDLPHDPFGPPIAQDFEYHADLGGWIRYYPKNDSWFSSERFAHLDGSPIDPALIIGTRIDRFEFTDREFYNYTSNGKRFIAFGVGPDGDADSTTETREAYLRSGDRRALAPFTYDPTNGIQSSGDIFLTDVD